MANAFYENERTITTAHGKNAPSATKIKIGAMTDTKGKHLFGRYSEVCARKEFRRNQEEEGLRPAYQTGIGH